MLKQSPPTLEEVVEEYDLRPRMGMILCPAHLEDTPSMKLNYDDNYYFCFGCGATGDAMGLIALLRGESVEDVLRSYALPSAGWKKPIAGLSSHELRASVLAAYRQVHTWFFHALHTRLDTVPDWVLLCLIERWSESFDEVRDCLNDEELSLYDKDLKVRELKARCEQWLDR